MSMLRNLFVVISLAAFLAPATLAGAEEAKETEKVEEIAAPAPEVEGEVEKAPETVEEAPKAKKRRRRNK